MPSRYRPDAHGSSPGTSPDANNVASPCPRLFAWRLIAALAGAPGPTSGTPLAWRPMSEVSVKIDGGVGVISLCAPERRNALTPGMAADLVAACEEVDARPPVGRLLLSLGADGGPGGDGRHGPLR